MLIGMRDMMRGVMLLVATENYAHTRRKHLANLWAEGLWGKLVAALWKLYSVFAAIRGELLET